MPTRTSIGFWVKIIAEVGLGVLLLRCMLVLDLCTIIVYLHKNIKKTLILINFMQDEHEKGQCLRHFRVPHKHSVLRTRSCKTWSWGFSTTFWVYLRERFISSEFDRAVLKAARSRIPCRGAKTAAQGSSTRCRWLGQSASRCDRRRTSRPVA